MKKITKKKEESVKEVITVNTSPSVTLKKQIGKLEIDLGRGDLNQVVEKINEIIEQLNGN